MAKFHLKEKALQYRKNGKGISEIAHILDVSKSTVSLWCRNIQLTNSQIRKIYNTEKQSAVRALVTAAEAKRRIRIEAETYYARSGADDVGKISKRDLFMVGLGLYWGEGYKSGNQEMAFTNSDPVMITIFIKWLREVYGINSKELICRVSINDIHKSRDSALIHYWSKLTGVPTLQFSKTSFIKTKTKKQYANNDAYFGVLRIKVRKATNLRRRILGSISKLKTS